MKMIDAMITVNRGSVTRDNRDMFVYIVLRATELPRNVTAFE